MCPKGTNMRIILLVIEHMFPEYVQSLRDELRFILGSIK